MFCQYNTCIIEKEKNISSSFSSIAKREIMLTPVTVAYSPKRSPKENLSPGFSHLLSKTESSPIR